MCFDGDAATVWDEKRVRARKPHVCCECHLPMPAGRDYIRIGCLSDGSWATFRVHVGCDALWDFIHGEVCGGEGLKMAGGLGEEIANQDDHDGQDFDDENDVRDWPLSTKATLEWLYEIATAPYREANDMNYPDFIASKRLVVRPAGIDDPPDLSPKLFPFQRDIVKWALRRGRAAIWADCGLGKGWMALEWARVIAAHTGLPVIILAPLAVAQQFAREGAKLGVAVTICRSKDDVRPGVNVANYERLHLFDLAAFGGVVLDESSCLKDFTSMTRNALIEGFASTPFRLACTATPAPNDHMELGNHAEFLGAMTRTEMLAMFFVHDGGDTSQWRLKGHARKDYWRWLCSWAVSIRRPSDLGYDDGSFALPPLVIHEKMVPVGAAFAKEAGALFITDANGIQAQRGARRSSLDARVAAAAEIVATEPGEQWLVWCDLNQESESLTAAIPGAVEVTGSDSAEQKEKAALAFADGDTRICISKSAILGMGMNFQRCARVVYVGLSNSFEAWYQSIRRIWRFGQTREVHCHIVISDADGAVRANLERKRNDAETMANEMLVGMGDIQRASVRALERDNDDYAPGLSMVVPAWLKTEESAA